MKRSSLVTLSACALALLPAPPRLRAATPPSVDPQAIEFFEKQVRPVLAERCFSCHGARKHKGGLRLDSGSALAKGSDNGPVIMPGDPEQSPLVRAIRYDGELKMPPTGKLPGTAISSLSTWVKMGAPWPEVPAAAKEPAADTGVARARQSHWAFRPIRKPSIPEVHDAAWVRAPVDRFVLAGLEEHGLTPAGQADRRTLIRRATFDLTGLPPSPEEVITFEQDPSPDAFARVVDRLLASPRYGERWARHWLDVARYADTRGYVFLQERRFPYAYTYRDYVIRAFNEDLPYDQFIVEQIAADRLQGGVSRQGPGSLTPDSSRLAALGFLTVGRRFLNNQSDIIDDRIDVVCRGLMSLTVGCARCHDHKFDPISSKDYYSLYGVFASSYEPAELPLIGKIEHTSEYEDFARELETRQLRVKAYLEKKRQELAGKRVGVPANVSVDRIARYFNVAERNRLTELRRHVEEWQASSAAAPPRAMVLYDSSTAVTPHVFLRGNPGNPGPGVPRRFLEVLCEGQRQPFRDGSGRLELARAIASKDNPLTARVLVNRVWMHHFGAGLVRTPGDFGMRGEPPTHPELLDFLAATFMENGWSIKKLHRSILLSSTYQQSCEWQRRQVPAAPSSQSSDPYEVDPENRWLWHMSRRRLEFEPMRDALLAVAGHLEQKPGGPSVELTSSHAAWCRSVYGFIERQNLPGLFRTFDLASPDVSTPRRFATTVPQQALFLMNSPFVIDQARGLAGRPDVRDGLECGRKIDRLYQLLYGRRADAEEKAAGQAFLTSAKPAPGEKLTAWEKYAQVLLLANEFAYID
jgi:hypothetical protein